MKQGVASAKVRNTTVPFWYDGGRPMMNTNSTTRGSNSSPATDEAAQRARLRSSLAGFEERLQRCRREALSFLHEHWEEARHRSELAFLLGQMHGMIDHCHQLERRYRTERICLAARDASMKDGHPGGSGAAAEG
jgi:hypothetical protein